jgi:crotonobetainyl-CoA:carnitine CoA-transferase CaiB-like acyl-CoA transferase
VGLDLNSAAGKAEAKRLALAADVVIAMRRPGELEAAGLDYKTLSELNPGLVFCSITGFGPTGPMAQVKADDALAMAKAGIMRDQRGWEYAVRPIFRASRDASFFSAMLAVQGVLAALLVRDQTGRGQLVETSLMQALAVRQNPNVRFILREGEALPVEAGAAGAGDAEVKSEKNVLPHHMDPREVTLIGARMQAKDGRWLVHSHTEPHFFPAWIKTIGFDWIWQDERFKGAPYQFPNPETKQELIRLIQARMKERTSDEWIEAYLANGNVCGDRMQTTQDALRHPQSVESGILTEVADPRVGPIVEIGPLVKISGAPGEAKTPAPEPRQHTEEIRKTEFAPPARIEPKGAKPARPLEGVTIVEAAYYYATPFATALLGELGARVIKIEPLRGDPYRNLGRSGGDPVLNLGHNNMVRAMSGKESITLNLKDPKGQEILHALVKKADIFIHNFRLGVPETLGMGEEQLRKVNPKLVYQYGASYGKIGPYARQPAIDPIIAAYAGTTIHQSGEGNLPLTETGADPAAAAGCAAAMMMALYSQRRTGQGQYAESAMIVSNIYLNYEDALAYEGKPKRRAVDKGQHGLGATYRLYKTAPVADPSAIPSYANPDPRWVFLVADKDAEFERFCKVAGREDLARDPRFATRKARAENDAALAEQLEAVFLTQPAKAWESNLLAADVGCVAADEMSHFAFLYRDPQAQAVGMMSMAEHPAIGGKYWRYAPMLKFSETPGHGGSFCEFDEHTTAVLTELGYDQAAISELQNSGVVASQADHAKLVASRF